MHSIMSNMQVCQKASMFVGMLYSACAHVVRTIIAKHTATLWLSVACCGMLCIVLSAALFVVSGAMAQPALPMMLWQTPAESVYWIEGIEPYDPACLQDIGAERVPLPPQLHVVYGEAEAFCVSDGEGMGRLTFKVTGRCRLVQWSGVTLEVRCHWLPLVVN